MNAPAQWSLRLARPGDAEGYALVEQDAARALKDEPGLEGIPLPPGRDAKGYREMIAQRHCLTAVSADRVIGFAATRRHGRELHLHELSVASRFQGQGTGSTLLGALKIDARNAGLRAITLDTFRDIAGNAPFYARRGFEFIDDLAPYPRLAEIIAGAHEAGIPRDMRCAMICFLN